MQLISFGVIWFGYQLLWYGYTSVRGPGIGFGDLILPSRVGKVDGIISAGFPSGDTSLGHDVTLPGSNPSLGTATGQAPSLANPYLGGTNPDTGQPNSGFSQPNDQLNPFIPGGLLA